MRRIASWIRLALVGGAASKADEPPSKPATAPGSGLKPASGSGSGSGQAPPERSMYSESIARLNDVAKWMIAALAAVATVMLAGSQLSSIGALPLSPPGRLVAAVGAALVAVVAVLAGIVQLSKVLILPTAGLHDLEDDAATKRLTPFVSGDPGFLEGRASVADLVQDYRKCQEDAISAGADVLKARMLVATRKGKKKAAAGDELAQAEEVLRAINSGLGVLRRRVYALSDLNRYLAIKAAFQRALRFVAGVALVVAAALMTFAWAANPPQDEPVTDEPAAGSH